MELKGKFVTTSKVKIVQNPSCHMLEKIIENNDTKSFFGYHELSSIDTMD